MGEGLGVEVDDVTKIGRGVGFRDADVVVEVAAGIGVAAVVEVHSGGTVGATGRYTTGLPPVKQSHFMLKF